MNHMLLALLLMFTVIPSIADEFELRSFEKDPNDLYARRFERKDVNGQVCAVIKVLTDIKGLKFTTNLGIEGHVAYSDGVYYLYVSPGEKRIQIFAEGFIPLVYNLPVPIEPATVYRMVLTAIIRAPGQAGNTTGFVLISSEPAGAVVWIDGVETGMTTPYQQLYNAGTYAYELRMELYEPAGGTFVIKPDETTRVNVPLTPNFGGLRVITTPEAGATVSIDGRLQQQTTPLHNERMSPGKYSLTVRKDMFETITRDVVIKRGETAEVRLTLQPLFAEVSIQTQPTADIYIDNQRVGNGHWQGRLIKGKHHIEARLERYKVYSQTIDIRVGVAENLKIALEPQTGSLAVSSIPPDAVIWIDGINYGETPKIIPGIQVGSYMVTLKKAGYADVSERVIIKENEQTRLNLTLPAGMQVTIASEPTGAELFINNQKVGTTPYTGQLGFGSHRIKLVNRTKTHEETISVAQGGTSTFRFNVSEPKDYTETAAGINLEMVLVRGGSFTMGCTGEQGSDCWDDEKPTRRVTVGDFYIGKYEVTQKQWREVMGSNPSYFQNCDNCPVENVSWDDVQEFIRKLNQLTGKKYRLPTEAEWEYAARGGATASSATATKYAGSNNLDEVAWYDGNSGNKTRPVGGKKPNGLGLYDMSGNVWEWCEDDWHGSYSGAPADGRAWVDSPRGSHRVLRGGSWNFIPQFCRVSNRGSPMPGSRINSRGFRLACAP